ncbi:MAG: sodium:proton antiporter [Microbacteriaceae bacterium]|nr:sodium:proton antiporter [Microbacteriaceae bacterium]MCL2794484.1 sodium:proton antiporter [Microbacteriaceae bacterium]
MHNGAEYTLIAAMGVLVLVTATGVSRRIGVAAPLLLVAIGAGLSYLPGAPAIHLEAEWILVIVLPPLLYGASVAFPVVDFRRNLAPIALLGVALVVLSAIAVGWVLFVIFPKLDLATAIALGAVLSPTDAVSATSIAKRLGLPSRVVTVLEGESLVNDASTLVLLRTAIASIAAVFDLGHAIGDFVWATIGGVIVGAIVGVLASAIRKGFRDAVLVTSISFAVPFFAYAPAEALNASGVIAVVTTGLIVGHRSVRTQTVQLRLVEQTNWRTLQFLLENGVFLVMGYQLREYIADDIHDGFQPGYTIALGLLAVAILVAVRVAFVFPMFAALNRRSRAIAAGRASRFGHAAAWVAWRVTAWRHRGTADDWRRLRERRERADQNFHRHEQIDWRASALIGWSGMRGVVTVAAVQALPPQTPYRSALILISFTAAVATLLLGGLTLPALARWLGIPTSTSSTREEVSDLFHELTGSARELLDDPGLTRADGTAYAPEVVARVREDLERHAALAARSLPSTTVRTISAEAHELRGRVLDAEREALADARATSTYGAAALATAEAVLNTLEAQTEQEDAAG